ncbi:MAG: AMP-binding protein, partial [Gemmatimonadaceae bacterium]
MRTDVLAPPLFPAHPDPIRTWRRLAPERIALVDRDRGERYSYAELDALADRLAGVLRLQGVRRNDRVGIIAGNRVEHVAALFACGRIGAALVPFNWRLTAAELAPVVDDARIGIVLGEEKHRTTAEQALASVSEPPRGVDLDRDVPALLRRGFAPASDTVLEPESAALVLYTSGSTGKPKGAVLPHRQILWNAIATTTAWQLGPDDVAPVGTPFFHTGGWNVFATPLWHRGGRVVLFDKFDPADYLDGLAEEGCTVCLTVPTQLLMLEGCARWGRELPAMRTFFSGGAPLPLALAERTRAAGYRLREGYGLTECGPNCFAISDMESLRKPGSVGWPIHYLEMRLVDARDEDVATGQPGELLLRGPQMFAGYLHDPARTADALAPGGWLRTGDLATRDADGAFSICGRQKEMFISGGENVFPGEVELAIAQCDGVAEVVVIGVADDKWGEVGRAFVVVRDGAALAAEGVFAFA